MAQIDVLIPHYNDIDGLESSLASIEAQDWGGHFRVVICDDGSQIETFNKIAPLIQSRRFDALILRNEVNRGRPYTRNVLLDAIESKYVCWLDAGDVWYPSKTRLQIEQLYRLKYKGVDTSRVWITCNYDWNWSGSSKRQLKKQFVDGDQIHHLFIGTRLRAYLWTLLGEAAAFKAIGHFDNRLGRLQDLDYFVRFVASGGRLHVPSGTQALCVYFKSDVGRSGDEVRDCNRIVLEKHHALLETYGKAFVANRAYDAEILAGRFARNGGDRRLARLSRLRAFAIRPMRFAVETIRSLKNGR